MANDEVAQLQSDLAKFSLSLSSFGLDGETVSNAPVGSSWSSSNGSTLTKIAPGSYKIRTP